jgi:[ribosomal protein S5]-alanine N-acetyltransferase
MSVSVPLATRLVGSRVLLRAQRAADAPALLEFHRRNADHLRPWRPAPPRGTNPLTRAVIESSIHNARAQWRRDAKYDLLVVARSPGEPIVGSVALSVQRGAFQSAYLGYHIDSEVQGQGLMTEAVGLAVDFAFGVLELHRVQAAILPRNDASRRVLAKSGFRREGLALRYLQIAGRWEDHELHAITREERDHPLVEPR